MLCYVNYFAYNNLGIKQTRLKNIYYMNYLAYNNLRMYEIIYLILNYLNYSESI